MNYRDRVPVYGQNIDYHMAMGLGFKFETDNLYGIPERKVDFKLKDSLKY